MKARTRTFSHAHMHTLTQTPVDVRAYIIFFSRPAERAPVTLLPPWPPFAAAVLSLVNQGAGKTDARERGADGRLCFLWERACVLRVTSKGEMSEGEKKGKDRGLGGLTMRIRKQERVRGEQGVSSVSWLATLLLIMLMMLGADADAGADANCCCWCWCYYRRPPTPPMPLPLHSFPCPVFVWPCPCFLGGTAHTSYCTGARTRM